MQWWLGWPSLLCIDEFAPSAFCKGRSIFCRHGSRGRVQNRPDLDAGMGSRGRACPALWLLPLATPHTEAESHLGLALSLPSGHAQGAEPPGASPAEDGEPIAVGGASPGAPFAPLLGGEATGSSFPHAHRFLDPGRRIRRASAGRSQAGDSELKGTWEPCPLLAPQLAVQHQLLWLFSRKR